MIALNSSYLRPLCQLSILLVLACAAYVAYHLMTGPNAPVAGQSVILETASASLPELDLDEELSTPLPVAHDIFSSRFAVTTPVVPVSQRPATGQLPANLKIVGIVIDQPAQVVVEDTAARQTYFVTEEQEQAGLKIIRVSADQIHLTYQGQDIPVPVRNKTRTLGD